MEEATKQGRAFMDARRKRIQENPNITPEAKEASEILYKRAMGTVVIPVDPTGSPLMIVDEPLKFLDEIEKRSMEGIVPSVAEFIYQHHQNCGGKVFVSYEAFKKAYSN